MTHDELLEEFDKWIGFLADKNKGKEWVKALRAVVELHKPSENYTGKACGYCFNQSYEPSGLEMMDKDFAYPCATIKVIEKELK